MTRTADFLAGFFCMLFMLAVLFWIYVASPPDPQPGVIVEAGR